MGQGEKPAQQARAQRTRDELVRALSRLLQRKSFEDIAVAEIAKEAGVSVGAVYRRFDNKDALIPALFEVYEDRLARWFGEAGGVVIDPEFGLRTSLRRLARASFAFLQREAPIARAAFAQARQRPDLVGEEWSALLASSRDSFRQLVQAFGSEIVRQDKDAAAGVVAYHFNTAFVEKALYRDEGVGALCTLEGDDFADAIADMAYGYLTTPDD